MPRGLAVLAGSCLPRSGGSRSRAEGKIPTAREAIDLLDAEFYTPFENRSSFERMKAAAERLVRAYLGRWKEDLGRVWATERPFELHLPDGVLSGRAGVILTAEKGHPNSLAIVDDKASTDPDARSTSPSSSSSTPRRDGGKG